MAETINWIKEERKNSLASHYIIEAMSKVGGIGLEKFGEFDASNINVEMKINGVEVPFMFFFEIIEKHLNEYEKKLEETAAEKVIVGKIEEFKEKISESLYDVFKINPWN